MRTIKGDLISFALDGKFDVIIHGCNCQHTMGSGIAKSIREVFPGAYDADRRTPQGSGKLGTISTAVVTNNVGTKLVVVNAYTQDGYGTGAVHADYDAIRRCMQAVKASFSGKRIGYPKIGAGLAGGDWGVIAAIIEEELDGEDHTLVEFVPGKI